MPEPKAVLSDEEATSLAHQWRLEHDYHRVNWVNRTTGEEGHGDWHLSQEVVDSWVAWCNEKHPGISHHRSTIHANSTAPEAMLYHPDADTRCSLREASDAS